MKIQLIIACFLLLVAGCRDKSLTELEFLEVKLEKPYRTSLGEVLLVGRTSGLNQSNAERCGFVWSRSPDSIAGYTASLRQIPAILLPIGNDSFSNTFFIRQNETVYFKAFAQLGERVVFSKETGIASLDNVVEMSGIPVVFNNTAAVSGLLLGTANLPIDYFGHVFSASEKMPVIGAQGCDSTQFLNGQSSPQLFPSKLENLQFNTTYYVRAYAISGNSAPFYSQQVDTFRVRDGWVQLPFFPSPFQDGAAIGASNGQAYAGFGINNVDGFSNDILKDFWRFDPDGAGGMGSWANAAPFDKDLIFQRTNTNMFAVGDQIFIIFGERTDPGGTTNAVRSMWKYTISTNQWSDVDIPIPISQNILGTRSGAVGFVIGNNIYVGAGRKYRQPPEPPVYLNDFWEYNTLQNTWAKVKSLPLKTDLGLFNYGRYDAIGFASSTHGYVGCGDYYGLPLQDFWRFTPPDINVPQDSGKWEPVLAPFPGLGRIDAVSFVIEGKAYLGSGWNITERNLDDFYSFDFATEKWDKITAFKGGPRRRMIGFALGQFGYAGTGIETVAMGQVAQDTVKFDFWKYIPEE